MLGLSTYWKKRKKEVENERQRTQSLQSHAKARQRSIHQECVQETPKWKEALYYAKPLEKHMRWIQSLQGKIIGTNEKKAQGPEAKVEVEEQTIKYLIFATG